MVRKYYFTYGSNSKTHPFQRGWSVVIAKNEKEAIESFKRHHPNGDNGFIRCCSWYDEETFKKTEMFVNGNFGVREHETIDDEYEDAYYMAHKELHRLRLCEAERGNTETSEKLWKLCLTLQEVYI